MSRVKFWYFVVEHKDGTREIVAYGDSTRYTQEQAIAAIKEICKNRNWTYIGITEE